MTRSELLLLVVLFTFAGANKLSAQAADGDLLLNARSGRSSWAVVQPALDPVNRQIPVSAAERLRKLHHIHHPAGKPSETMAQLCQTARLIRNSFPIDCNQTVVQGTSQGYTNGNLSVM